MTEKEMEVIADGIILTVKEAIDPLKKKIAELEARPLPKWAGTFADGKTYHESELCTHKGSLWLAMQDTTTTPGEPGGAWRLIVKRGDVR